MSKADRVVRGCFDIFGGGDCEHAKWTGDGLRCRAKSNKGRIVDHVLYETEAPSWCPLPITVRKEADHE